jgi:hypothetical protein
MIDLKGQGKKQEKLMELSLKGLKERLRIT